MNKNYDGFRKYTKRNKECVGVDKSDVVTFLNGRIERAGNDDVRNERDRLIYMLQDLDLEVKEYRKLANILCATNDEVEKIVNNEPRSFLSYAKKMIKNYFFDSAYGGYKRL